MIPVEHAELLARAFPNGHAFVTGTYAHTGSASLRELVPRAAAEGRAMWGILSTIAQSASP